MIAVHTFSSSLKMIDSQASISKGPSPRASNRHHKSIYHTAIYFQSLKVTLFFFIKISKNIGRITMCINKSDLIYIWNTFEA